MIPILISLIVAAVVAILLLTLNSAYVPTPQDANLKIEDAITKSATYAGTAFDLGSGFAPGGVGQPMNAVVDPTSITLNGTNSFDIALMECATNTTSSAFTASGPTINLNSSSSAAAFSVPGIVSKRYVKLALTLNGAGTLSLSAWLNPGGFAAAR